MKGNATKPVLEIFGKVEQSGGATTAAKAADAAMQRAADAATTANSAGFPKGPPVVHGQDLGRNALNPVAVMAAQAQSGAQINSAAALGSEKAVHDASNQQGAKGNEKGKSGNGHQAKQAKISENPPEVHEVGNSNKMTEQGAMTDGSKRRQSDGG